MHNTNETGSDDSSPCEQSSSFSQPTYISDIGKTIDQIWDTQLKVDDIVHVLEKSIDRALRPSVKSDLKSQFPAFPPTPDGHSHAYNDLYNINIRMRITLETLRSLIL